MEINEIQNLLNNTTTTRKEIITTKITGFL